MYFLYDLYQLSSPSFRDRYWKTNPMPFETKEAILDFWYARCGHDWTNLNVTGSDMLSYVIPRFRNYDKDGGAVYENVVEQYTRRYLVRDGHGRNIDPRDWGMEIRPMDRPRRHYWFSTGAKTHHCRASGPSMFRRTAMAACGPDYEETEDGGVIPVPPVRRKALLSWTEQDDVYERRWFGRSRHKSWKNYNKTRRQHGRHDKNGKGRTGRPGCAGSEPWANLVRDGFPVHAGTTELCEDAA